MKHIKLLENYVIGQEGLRVRVPINEDLSQEDPIKVWDTFYDLLSGVDGIMSEEGDISRYWDQKMYDEEIDPVTQTIKTAGDVKDNLDNIKKWAKMLLDGVEGNRSEGKYSEDRYWQPGAIEAAKKMF